MAAYQRAISADANLAIAHNNLAVCYLDKHGEGQAQLDRDKHGEGQALALRLLDEARAHAETAVRLAPNEQNYWDTLAHVYALLGLDKKARHGRQP